MPEVPEYVINVKLAEILRKDLKIDARAERISKERKRPDIMCRKGGLIIPIEVSYDRADAEKDAEKRIEQKLGDIAIALLLKIPYKDVPEEKLEEAIRRSTFDVKVFIPRDVAGTLIPFLEKGMERKPEPATGWFTDVDIPMLGTMIENAVEFLVKEEEAERLSEEIKEGIDNLVKVLSNIDANRKVYKQIYNILYRLYGLSIAEAEDPDVVFGQALLSILLSATFYEHARNWHPELKPLSAYADQFGPIEGLKRALRDLLKIDYRTAIETSLKILGIMPPNMASRIKDLVEQAVKVAQSPSLLRRDFAGRVYHEITGDIALRKGFATFYTEVPAAYLLASLAIGALLLDERDLDKLSPDDGRRIVERIKSMRIGDLACGSGTLLTGSYSALQRLVTELKIYCDLEDVDLNEITRAVIEEGIYGIDALRYASQITALNLALISDGKISRENTYTIYLGLIPKDQEYQAWLGSLELFKNGERVGGLLNWMEKEQSNAAGSVTLQGSDGAFSIPSEFDLMIMNPPFTRATGRTKRFGKGRGLFGFIADEGARSKLVDAYDWIRKEMKDELRIIAEASANIFPGPIREIVRGKGEFNAYLNIGQAGEGLLFLYLAYKYVKDGGVIAFVLPRGLLAGVTWFLARVLLASKFHVNYIVVSSDTEKGYNFSEGASLSETLVVARKANNISNNETIFVNLLRKPLYPLEGQGLAEEIRKTGQSLREGEARLIEVGSSSALLLKVSRQQLLENIDNWNRFVAMPDPDLVDMTVNHLLRSGEIGLKGIDLGTLKLHLTRLNDIISTLGIDAHQFHDNFSRVDIRTPYPIIYGGEEDVRSKMVVRPNSFASQKTNMADSLFRTYAARVLIPDRIRWNTAHVIALYSEEPVLSNIFYTIKLRVDDDIRAYAEKALVLWLNTTWGILTVLFNRQETEGGWTRLKMAQWRLLPVLDVSKLDLSKLRELADVFDRYAEKTSKRLPEQFNPKDSDPIRLGIDIDFLKAFDPNIDENKAREALLDLYRHIYEAFKLWMSSDKDVDYDSGLA